MDATKPYKFIGFGAVRAGVIRLDDGTGEHLGSAELC